MRRRHLCTNEFQKYIHDRRPRPQLMLVLLFVIFSPVLAQPSITRFTIDGGGGSSQGGTSEVSGTIGQPDAGLLTGGTIQIRGGFWVGRASVGSETPTPTPTESLPTTTPTPTETPAATLPTPTASPIETGLDVQPNPLDEFIDALDVIEWVSRVKSSDSSSDVLFELSVFWQGEYPPSIKTHELSK